MTRTIEFRAWLPDAKMSDSNSSDMFYQGDQYLSSFISRIYDKYGVTHPSYLNFELEERLTEFTGLFDKNGVKIFEGDIIHIIDKSTKPFLDKCIVKFNDRIAAFEGFFDNGNSVYLQNNYVEKGLKYDVLKTGRTIEVVGNILQNPELINKEQND